jgi:hypothetical protein
LKAALDRPKMEKTGFIPPAAKPPGTARFLSHRRCKCQCKQTVLRADLTRNAGPATQKALSNQPSGNSTMTWLFFCDLAEFVICYNQFTEPKKSSDHPGNGKCPN